MRYFYHLWVFLYFPLAVFSGDVSPQLTAHYEEHCSVVSDIYEHVPVLRNLALECQSAVEIGVRSLVSTWGVLQGLAENPHERCSYIGIDLERPPGRKLHLAKKLARQHNIDFEMIIQNDMEIELPKVDLLFIDSLHTYAHLTYELEKFSSQVRKYIAMHDTSAPWGSKDDADYHGDYSEYPEWINRSKRGLWPAVVDFLKKHPEWTLQERRLNCHGFTILKRVGQ